MHWDHAKLRTTLWSECIHFDKSIRHQYCLEKHANKNRNIIVTMTLIPNGNTHKLHSTPIKQY